MTQIVFSFSLKVIRAYEIIRPMKFLLGLLLVNLCFAQHAEQPQKENASDLRNQTSVFVLHDVESKKIYRLERDPSLSYALRMNFKDNESVLKIDSREAGRLDRDFAARFLKAMYEIPTAEGNCDVTLRLNLKGEEQNICKKDDKKAQELAPLLHELSKRF